jgi:hypothetical protein
VNPYDLTNTPNLQPSAKSLEQQILSLD